MSAWVGLEVQKNYNVQLVNTYHSLGAVKYQSVPNRPTIANTRLDVERRILEQANCTVATSPQEQEALRNLVSSQGHVEVIPCGTDVENFHVIPKSDARSQLGFRLDEKVVLYVGRFDPRKGIETLVRACAQLKASPSSVRLVIVGGSEPTQPDGEERHRIERIVQELELSNRATFAGRVGHDRLPLYYTLPMSV